MPSTLKSSGEEPRASWRYDGQSSDPAPVTQELDEWSALISFERPNQPEVELSPQGATLLPSGDVIFYGHADDSGVAYFVMTPTAAVTETGGIPVRSYDPELPGQTDLISSGHSLTSDGRYLNVGGTTFFEDGGSNHEGGYAGGHLYDEQAAMPVEILPPMIGEGGRGRAGRFYPAVTRLPDTSMLVSSGWDWTLDSEPFLLVGTFNRSVERLNVQTKEWSLISSHDDAPIEIANDTASKDMINGDSLRDHTGVYLLPAPVGGRDVLFLGQPGHPIFLDTAASNTWSSPGDTVARPSVSVTSDVALSPNHGASTAMLPIRLVDGEWGYGNGSVIVAGGTRETGYEHRADVYDPVANKWLFRTDLITRRPHTNVVVLPTGRVLIIGGGDSEYGTDNEAGRAQFIDFSNGKAVLTNGQSSFSEVRSHHSVALLLPDGRVLVGAGHERPAFRGGRENPDFRLYSPPYMLEKRPVLAPVDDEVRIGGTFTIVVTSGSADEVVLMGLGSVTHHQDTNARYVQLALGEGSSEGATTSYEVTAPPLASVATPGHYMLFVLRGGVPSIAKIVRLLAAA